MRVLFFNYEYPPIGGGGANANAYLFQQFARCPELRVDCITSAAGRDDETLQVADNIRLYRLAVGKKQPHFWTQPEILAYLWRAHRKAAELMASNRYDLCHAFFGFPSGLLAWLRRVRLPYLVSLRGSDVPGFNPRFSAQYLVLKPIFRRIWAQARFTVPNSAGLRRLAGEFMPELEMPVIPNGIDAEEFSPGLQGERGPGQLLCVSRLVARKGVQHLLEAMPLILEACPGTRLTVIGEGDMLARLSARRDELGLGGCVEFSGYVPHEKLPDFYRRAALFVQPSFYEGMSNTVLEAMACGLPVVATGEGGREELLGANAVQAPFGDPRGLAGAVVALLQDPGRMAAMGRTSRERAIAFSWPAVADRYLELYRRMLSAEGSTGD